MILRSLSLTAEVESSEGPYHLKIDEDDGESKGNNDEN